MLDPDIDYIKKYEHVQNVRHSVYSGVYKLYRSIALGEGKGKEEASEIGRIMGHEGVRVWGEQVATASA